MDSLFDRTAFDDLEDEVLKWASEWDAADDALYATPCLYKIG